MRQLMITWTDIFNATGDFFEWTFKGVRALGHGPNIVIWVLIVFVLAYWTVRLMRYKKEAAQNNTIE